MDEPIVLRVKGTPLYLQVVAHLGTDTDPEGGIVAALGQREDDNHAASGVNSIYPNFTTNGPSPDRRKCPTPFLIVGSGGKRADDKINRTFRFYVEVHDDKSGGIQRWPGLVRRVVDQLCGKGFRPKNDEFGTYTGGAMYAQESGDQEDSRYNTTVVGIEFTVSGSDRSSGHGYAG